MEEARSSVVLEVEEEMESDSFVEVDAMHARKEYESVYAELVTQTEPEALWRLARVCVDLSERQKKDKVRREKYVREALKAAEEAVLRDPTNAYGQKWYGAFQY